jgi:hypothetical protein
VNFLLLDFGEAQRMDYWYLYKPPGINGFGSKIASILNVRGCI